MIKKWEGKMIGSKKTDLKRKIYMHFFEKCCERYIEVQNMIF